MKQPVRRIPLLLAVVLVALAAVTLVAGAQTADPYPSDAWYVQYWENVDLAGPPVATRFGQNINFNWGLGYPEALEGQNTFSVRWTRNVAFDGGYTRFVATMDDGMRVWLDDSLIIDAWGESAQHTVSKDVYVFPGRHNVRVDYQDRGGVATARLNWSPVGGGNTYPNWKGEYFANPTLTGTPALVRDDRHLDFNWGFGAAALSLPPDYFSARWNHTFNGVPGQYRVNLTSDDGARLYINDQLVIDNWGVQAQTTRSIDAWFAPPVRLRVEYFDASGAATLRLQLIPVPGGQDLLPPTPTPAPPVVPSPDETITCPVAPTPSNGVVISARPLNVRAGAGQTFAIIGQLQPCAQPLLTGNATPDGSWIEVLTPDGALGWVLGQYLLTVDEGSGGVG